MEHGRRHKQYSQHAIQSMLDHLGVYRDPLGLRGRATTYLIKAKLEK